MNNGIQGVENSSLSLAYEMGKKSQDSKRNKRAEIAKANRIFSWVVGIVLALLPLLVSGFFALLYEDGNPTLAGNYLGFLKQCVYSGNFLWLGITLLAMSLVDLLLYGFYNKLTVIRNRILVVVSIVICLIGGCIYTVNIGNPMSHNRLLWMSVIAFGVFALVSWKLSFKIAKGV